MYMRMYLYMYMHMYMHTYTCTRKHMHPPLYQYMYKYTYMYKNIETNRDELGMKYLEHALKSKPNRLFPSNIKIVDC